MIDPTNKTPKWLKLYYLFWIKRVDARHHCSFGTNLHAGAKILPNVTIGNYCHVGANAVMVEDMPDYSTCVMQKPRIIIRNENI